MKISSTRSGSTGPHTTDSNGYSGKVGKKWCFFLTVGLGWTSRRPIQWCRRPSWMACIGAWPTAAVGWAWPVFSVPRPHTSAWPRAPRSCSTRRTTPRGRTTGKSPFTTRAAENTIWFASCNTCLVPNQNSQSLVIAPDGRVHTDAPLKEETLVVADIDVDLATRAMFNFDSEGCAPLLFGDTVRLDEFADVFRER